MGGRTRRRWRFWRRALGVALCWRRDYEPCESDDGSRISQQSHDTGSRISPRCDSAPGSVIDSRNGNRDDDRLAQSKNDICYGSIDDAGGDRGDISGRETGGVCCPSSVLKRLATMEQPISVRCAKTGDIVYKVDLVEETLECMRRRSRSLTFFMDRERTDDQRLTLYGLLAPGCEAWTVAFVQDDGDGCRAHVRIEPDSAFAV
ncbi:hypothetical protein pkur_cds_584 [Pandoravirus kuranda]|uniref:Uncharacterized protein n=1 Tax=Pandoravirus kuranda TaxID=3019033 RepID=A0AA95J4I8_9VIRU|nr:hypothetical protein pkur_cds_584 [Pandoravirus kuranda]